MKQKLTRDDKLMIRYFWEEYGDITKYVGFQELIPILEKEKPGLLKAIEDYKAIKAILDVLVSNL